MRKRVEREIGERLTLSSEKVLQKTESTQLDNPEVSKPNNQVGGFQDFL